MMFVENGGILCLSPASFSSSSDSRRGEDSGFHERLDDEVGSVRGEERGCASPSDASAGHCNDGVEEPRRGDHDGKVDDEPAFAEREGGELGHRCVGGEGQPEREEEAKEVGADDVCDRHVAFASARGKDARKEVGQRRSDGADADAHEPRPEPGRGGERVREKSCADRNHQHPGTCAHTYIHGDGERARRERRRHRGAHHGEEREQRRVEHPQNGVGRGVPRRVCDVLMMMMLMLMLMMFIRGEEERLLLLLAYPNRFLFLSLFLLLELFGRKADEEHSARLPQQRPLRLRLLRLSSVVVSWGARTGGERDGGDVQDVGDEKHDGVQCRNFAEQQRRREQERRGGEGPEVVPEPVGGALEREDAPGGRHRRARHNHARVERDGTNNCAHAEVAPGHEREQCNEELRGATAHRHNSRT
mmetsp:Transcript_9722/g.31819  ORF Transcript_9722/g.31819 Transcript_9722/m.31819 type:complete len:418 (+) Transcript_9722:446-1699(+)